MRQQFTSAHNLDGDNPAGGNSHALGIDVRWQNGPLVVDGVRVEPSGAFVETVIAIAKDRIAFYQTSKFSCRENALAITKLDEALHWLQARTADRETRGVEGTHNV